MNTNKKEIIDEENIEVSNEDSNLGDETQDEVETIEPEIVPEDLEEAEVLEDAEIVEEDEEVEELLESDKEKDMRKSKKKLEAENKTLQDDVNTFKDKLLRTTAEYENFRKRTTKEKQNIYTDACADVLKEVLPVLDNLELALSVEGGGDELRTGVEMTARLFSTAFKKLGVEEIATDVEFDPNFHNAVMHVEDEQYGTSEIVEVFQKGYKKGDKVLKHSMVKVAN